MKKLKSCEKCEQSDFITAWYCYDGLMVEEIAKFCPNCGADMKIEMIQGDFKIREINVK